MSLGWYKSSFSGSEHTCVEVRFAPDFVLMRDSKFTGPADEQPIVSVPAATWQSVLDLVLSGNSGRVDGDVTITIRPDGGAILAGQGRALVYRPDEWDAFAKGVADGQFDFPA
ncbi:hypothetical protein ABIA39_000295 [Nocardia sp. GAS34]|uniref:DUF397 domain-containing protein n=1 Tax=unclassified Nocardia TaxID=2637762 RepID=UPI003D240E8F